MSGTRAQLTDLQRKRLNEESLLNQIENNGKEYLKIRKVIEEKVNHTLSNGATLLKLAVSCVLQSMKKNPELYISLIQDKFSSSYYHTSSNPNYSNNCDTHDYELMLVNNVAKLYSMLARNLVDEILSKYDINSSQSSLPLALSSNEG